MEITEQQLSSAGGWQAMKAAREHLKLSQVVESKRDERGFHGLVGSGKLKYKASLLLDQKGKIEEGRCSCPDGRRGMICSHALAVALQVLQGGGVKTQSVAAESRASLESKSQNEVKKVSEMPKVSVSAPRGRYHFSILWEQLNRLDRAGTVPVFVRREEGDEVVDEALWSWMVSKGLHQVPAARLTANEIVELLELGQNRAEWWIGNVNEKYQRKLIIKNNLFNEFTSTCDYDLKCVDIELTSYKYYINYDLGLFAYRGEMAEEVLIHLNNNVKTTVKELLINGKSRLEVKYIAVNLSSLSLLFGEVKTWAKKLYVKPLTPKFTLKLEGNLKRLLLQAEVEWNEEGLHGLLSADINHIYPIEDDINTWTFYVRNEVSELQAARLLEENGLTRVQAGIWGMSGENEVLQFLAHGLPRLRKFFKVQEGEQWQSITRSLAVIRPQLKVNPSQVANERSVGAGMDWLNLEVAYEAENGLRVSRNEVLRLIRSGQRQGRTADGKRFVLDVEGCEELEETLHDLSAKLENGGQRLSVKRWQAGVLTEFAGYDQRLGEIAEPLTEVDLQNELGSLAESLRYYQKDGVTWMERLGRSQLGGLLADEMGLGKTVQTLAMIRLLLKNRENSKEPGLVICPTSLLGNWRDEAAKFVPDLRVHVSHDTNRHEYWDRFADYDVILTSYQLVARDIDMLRKMTFAVVVMDEASYVRNADTVTAKAIQQLQKRTCFALTGTPVENSVKDLWSIFEIVLPGYLPSKETFHERYVKKLSQPDSRQAMAAMERLRRLVRPYVLRRTKIEVAKDLPEKLEQVLWCELSPMQKEVYRRILEEGREEIRAARKKRGQGAARMTMFTILLRLRQVCNDLRLLGMGSDNMAKEEEGKWGRFDEMVQELIEGDHRALVFSQFVGMLKLVRERFDKAGIEYCYLDGATRNRAEQVAEFQKEGSGKRFFLISLKAGGYGLNLTAADHVLLLDPWWNPAVEAQAIDRAHRIGQVRPVTAARFVMRGTVEEKILQLQEKKRAVMDMAMEDDVAVMSGVTDDELEAMLEG